MYPVCAVALNFITIQALGERPRETGAAMTVSSADVRAILECLCARPGVPGAFAKRALEAVIAALGSAGITQGQISAPVKALKAFSGAVDLCRFRRRCGRYSGITPT
jgi:ABC-type cobalamin transport system permease subunit